MATSGSTDYNETTAEIIKDALLEISVIAVDDDIDAPTFALAQRKLNRMIKAWEADGVNLWREAEGSLTLVANKQSYTFGNSGDVSYRPLRFSSIRYRNSSGTDLPMGPFMSREDYFNLPGKSVTGVPTQFYYDPGLNQGTLYVWPVPSSVTTETLQYTYSRTVEDMDNNADNPDYPQEWLEALVLGLASSLQPSFFPDNVTQYAALKDRAMQAYERAYMWDRETASVNFIACGYDG